MLRVCEIFVSIQGESTYAGRICSFVRLSGCNLSCLYCDTKYAFIEGRDYSVEQIVAQVKDHHTKLVEITGGEPLLQNDTFILCKCFLDSGYTVLIETNGSLPIDTLPDGCIRIVDVKCPGSGQGASFFADNIQKLKLTDEVKFVISDKHDFDWAVNFMEQHKLDHKATVLFSPCIGKVLPSDLASWVLEKNIPVRLGLQLHKFIWDDKRGV